MVYTHIHAVETTQSELTGFNEHLPSVQLLCIQHYSVVSAETVDCDTMS